MSGIIAVSLVTRIGKILLTRSWYGYIVTNHKMWVLVSRRWYGPTMSWSVLLRRIVTITCCAIFLVLAAAEYPSVTVRAGEGFQPVSLEELKMTNEPLAPGAPAIILYRQVDRDDDYRGASREYNYVRIKILTEEGRRYANVEIPFAKGICDVSNLRARTIRPDGSIAEFAGKVFEKSLAKSRGLRVFAKTIYLPDVQIGSVIEYFYTFEFRELRLFESKWILSEELFTRRAKFSLIPYNDARGKIGVRWSWQGLPAGTLPPKRGPGYIVSMEANNIPAFTKEDFMPPEDELKSRVDFIYEESRLQRDTAQYWKTVEEERNGALESFLGKRQAMEKAVAQIVLPNDPPEVKLRKLYERVQHMRNTSFELQQTAQQAKREKEEIAQNVEDVWKRGYGNVTTLNWLYLALVRAAGFEGYGCWVSDRQHYFFTRDTTQSRKLDASVVLVKLNGKDLYLDPGTEFAPFGMLIWYETGVEGLQLNKDGATWIVTTLPASSESHIDRLAKFKLSDTGDLNGKLTLTYTGLDAMDSRIELRHADEIERKMFLEDRVKAQVLGDAEAELTNKPDWSGVETPLVAEFDVKIRGWSSNSGKRVLIPATVFTAAERHVFEHADRVNPIYFEYPHEKSDDVTIELPPGWQVASAPREKDLDTKGLGYGLRVQTEKDAVHQTRKFRVAFLTLEQKYYPALRSFFQFVRAGDEEQIVLQPRSATASK